MPTCSEHETVEGDLTGISLRDYLKCWQCRHDGKKCLPGTDGKCCRCARLGHTCGPLERAPARGKRRTTSRGSNIPNGDNGERNNRESARPAASLVESPQDIHKPDCTLNRTQLVGLVAASQVLLRCRSELAFLLQRVSDNAALKHYDICLRSLAATLSSQYRIYIQRSAEQSNLANRSPFDSDILYLTFEILQLQHLRLDAVVEQSISDTTSNPHALYFNRINSLHVDHPLLRCTERIAAAVDPASLHSRMNFADVKGLHADEYHKAQTQLTSMFEATDKQSQDFPEEDQWSAAIAGTTTTPTNFPAANLAYWNCDKETAFKIATSSGTIDLSADVTGQTIVHIAVISRDIGFLKRLVDFDKLTFVKASAIPGFTPLDLATILDDADIFGLLLGRGLNFQRWTSHLLDLAIAANSPSIVDLILERGMMVLPPYTAVTAAAIEKRLEDIALRFVQWLEPPWTHPREIEMLLLRAGHMGLHRLVAALRTLAPQPMSASRPIRSLQQHLRFLTSSESEASHGANLSLFSSFGSPDTQLTADSTESLVEDGLR